MPKFDNRRQRYLDNEEAKAVLDNIRKVDISGNWYDISLFAINTGLRRSEIFNLTSNCFNLNDKTVKVVDTKSNKNRIVPLNDTAYGISIERIQNLKNRQVPQQNLWVTLGAGRSPSA